jgi:hypothetical protein
MILHKTGGFCKEKVAETQALKTKQPEGKGCLVNHLYSGMARKDRQSV